MIKKVDTNIANGENIYKLFRFKEGKGVRPVHFVHLAELLGSVFPAAHSQCYCCPPSGSPLGFHDVSAPPLGKRCSHCPRKDV